MDDDEIADGVEDFEPVPVGLLHAGKEAGIFESDAGMSGNSTQQLMIFDGGRRAAIGKTKNADEFARGAGEADQGAIGPTESGRESCTEHVLSRSECDFAGV